MPKPVSLLVVITIGWAAVYFFTSAAAEELAAMLAEMLPGSLERIWYTSSGSEAIEAALKLARQYHLERGEAARKHLIARRLSYHGNTLGALAAGGTCTGEHGIGIGKREALVREHGTEAVSLMRRIKAAIDPDNILNPGKLFLDR